MKIPSQFQTLADRFGVPLSLVLAAAGFLSMLVLALLIGLVSSATHHSPSPQTNPPRLQAQAGPVGPSPAVAGKPASTPTPANVNATPPAASQALAAASLANATLPALPAPRGALQSGAWQLTVQTVDAIQGQDPTTLQGQNVGTVMKASPTASFSGAVPDSMAPFVTMGKPVRLEYRFNFTAPTTGSYLLTASLSGNASASARVLLDGRADALMTLKRNYNALWSPDSPAQAGSASVVLGAGVHSIEAVLDTMAATQAAHAPTLDFYFKPATAPMPSAMVPLWPASAPAAPVAASQPLQGARHE